MVMCEGAAGVTEGDMSLETLAGGATLGRTAGGSMEYSCRNPYFGFAYYIGTIVMADLKLGVLLHA